MIKLYLQVVIFSTNDAAYNISYNIRILRVYCVFKVKLDNEVEYE